MNIDRKKAASSSSSSSPSDAFENNKRECPVHHPVPPPLQHEENQSNDGINNDGIGCSSSSSNYASATPSKQRRPQRNNKLAGRLRSLFRLGLLITVSVFTVRQLKILTGYHVSVFDDTGTQIAPALQNQIAFLPHEDEIPPLSSSISIRGTTTDTAAEDAVSIVDNNTSKKTTETKTLALLYPPGLLGGYRNQVMRFIALATYANTHNMTQMLLNSLLFSTQLNGVGGSFEWDPIPFEWVFDVDHFNTLASEGHLPQLVRWEDQLTKVRLDEEDEGNCWTPASEMEGYEQLVHGSHIDSLNETSSTHLYSYRPTGTASTTINHLQRAALLQGTLTPLMQNVTVPFIMGSYSFNPRKVDFQTAVEHCQHPYVYGGGKQAGRLWHDYLRFHKGMDAAAAATQGNYYRNTSAVPLETDVWVYRALRPAPPWRALAEECVAQHAATGHYIALHARVELEIMGHICGRTMEKNLTRIVERVYDLYGELSRRQQPPIEDKEEAMLSGLFVAASRTGMEEKETGLYERFKDFADENLRTLNALTGHNSSSTSVADSTATTGVPQAQQLLFQNISQQIPVFECGERILKDYYAAHPDVPDHGALLQSVINFHLAVSADIFVGVKGSSYSTDVLTTRYWLGKGDANYRYTLTGVERVQGLPEPHGQCKGK